MPAPQRPRGPNPGGPEPAIYPRGFSAAHVVADAEPAGEVSATVAALREARQELAELMARLAGRDS